MRKEHHGKRLARPLRVPEHANLAVAVHGLNRAVDGLGHPEVLVVSGEDLHDLLACIVEAHEVLDDVHQARFGHHAVNHGLPSGHLGLGVVTVDRLPGYVAVLIGGDRSHAGLGHIAHDAEDVRDEHAGNVMHVVSQLQVGVRSVGLLARGALQFEENEWHAVDEADNVGSLLRILDEGPLVDDVKSIVLGLVEVEQANDVVVLLFSVEVANLDS